MKKKRKRKPAQKRSRFVKKHGILVFRSEEPLTPAIVEETARKIHEKRFRRLMGEDL